MTNYYPMRNCCLGCRRLLGDCSQRPFHEMQKHRNDSGDLIVMLSQAPTKGIT
jgi:hypothetical protein